jgi:hypothetical protein
MYKIYIGDNSHAIQTERFSGIESPVYQPLCLDNLCLSIIGHVVENKHLS